MNIHTFRRKAYLMAALLVAVMALFAVRAEASCEAPFPCSHEPPAAEPAPVLTAQSDAAANAQSASVAVGTGVGTASADSTNINGQSQGQSLDADLSNRNVSSNTNGQAQSVDNDQAQRQEANNEGNSLSVRTDYRVERQAPAVAQGSFAIQGCGVAGNTGGSNPHGALFLGVGFTTPECYAFMLAQAYDAVGERQAACLILNNTRAAKRAARAGVELPICAERSSRENYVTKDELDRVIKKGLVK